MDQTIRSSNRQSYVSVLLLLSLLLAACGTKPSLTPPSPSEMAQVAPEATIPPVHTPFPSDTLAPPTSTPAPLPSTMAPLATPSSSSVATGTPEETGSHAEEWGDFSLVVPAGWATASWQGATFIMESDAVLSFPGQTPDVFASVGTQWLFDLVDIGIDIESLAGPADLLAASRSLQWLAESLQRFTGNEEFLEINGYPAYAVTTKDKKDRHEYVVLILAKDIGRVAILEGISSPKRWEDVLPTFEAIASSLTLSEVQIEKVDPTLDELQLPTREDLGDELFVSEEYGYQIAYPDGWLILDGEYEEVSLSLDAAHSLCDESSGMEWSECHTPVVVAVLTEPDIMKEFDGVTSESDTLYLLELIAMRRTPGPTYIGGKLETLEVNGIPANGARFYGSDYAHDEYQSFRGYIVFVKGDTQAAVIWTTTPTAVWQQFRPVFAAMMNSFAFVTD